MKLYCESTIFSTLISGGFRFNLISHKSPHLLIHGDYPETSTLCSFVIWEWEISWTCVIIGDFVCKEKEENKPFPSKTFTEKGCALQNPVEIFSNTAERLGAWWTFLLLNSMEHPVVWQLGSQIQHANGLCIRCTHSTFCSMHASKYFLSHWAETLNCAFIGLWAATIALMLSGSITLHLHIAPLSRSIYRGQCLRSPEPKTWRQFLCPLSLTKVQVQISYSISIDSKHRFVNVLLG